jgi:hypothetical protein
LEVVDFVNNGRKIDVQRFIAYAWFSPVAARTQLIDTSASIFSFSLKVTVYVAIVELLVAFSHLNGTL